MIKARFKSESGLFISRNLADAQAEAKVNREKSSKEDTKDLDRTIQDFANTWPSVDLKKNTDPYHLKTNCMKWGIS